MSSGFRSGGHSLLMRTERKMTTTFYYVLAYLLKYYINIRIVRHRSLECTKINEKKFKKKITIITRISNGLKPYGPPCILQVYNKYKYGVYDGVVKQTMLK